MGGDVVAESLERQETERLGFDVAADEPEGPIGEQDMTRFRGLLEAGGEVDRSARDSVGSKPTRPVTTSPEAIPILTSVVAPSRAPSRR